MEKYDTATEPTDDNIIRGLSFPCRINKARDRHSDYVILFIHSKNYYAKVSFVTSVCTLPVLLGCNTESYNIPVIVLTLTDFPP